MTSTVITVVISMCIVGEEGREGGRMKGKEEGEA